MSDLIVTTSSARPLAVPTPRRAIATRVATMDDLPFLDGLQKQHSRQLGFFPRAQMEGYVTNGWVLVAEDAQTRTPLGYCASRDRYLKRDELGVIYQLCVAPGDQRKLIGAALIQAVFERSAYGCRLFCCWCAQDLAANYFWESLGFVPIAFRAGSTGKKRVHIFWQRRIVEGDTIERTPYWYPFKTDQGAIREDRLVFPIPPGTHWTDVQAVAVPTASDAAKALPDGETKPKPQRKPKPIAAPPQPVSLRAFGGLCIGARLAPAEKKVKAPKPKAPAAKACPERSRRIDPKYLAGARELRDRYLERVNENPAALESAGKYDVSRMLAHESHESSRMLKALPSAA